MLIFCGCHNKVSQGRWLKTTEICFLTVLEAKSTRTKCRQSWSLPWPLSLLLAGGHFLPVCSHHLPSVHTCKSLNVFPQNLYDKILILNVKIVLESETFWRWIYLEGRVLINGISVFRRDPREILCPFHCWRWQKDSHLWTRPPLYTKPACTLISDLPVSRTMRNKFLLLISHPSSNICYSKSENKNCYVQISSDKNTN